MYIVEAQGIRVSEENELIGLRWGEEAEEWRSL
jgi:hypothetical protein